MKGLNYYWEFYKLAIKYYAQGDSWEEAKALAHYFVTGNWRN